MPGPYDGPPGSAEAAARLVSQLTDHAVIALDPHGRITSWNEGARRLKGYEAADAIGKNFSMFYTRSDRATGLPFALLEDAREHGSASHAGRRVRQDGSEFWGDSVITALHDDDGYVTGFAKVTRDLTDRHDLEVALRLSEERFRSLVEQVVDYAIIGLDDDGTVVSWNAGAERLKQYTAEEALGRHFSVFHTEEDRDEGLPERLLTAARADGHVQNTGWRVRSGGDRFWAHVVITALRDDHGETMGYAKVTRDLTAQRRFEEAREAFFNAFAHDFRHPVSAIAGFADLVDVADPVEAADLVERIRTNARRLVEMTHDLVEHTRVAAQSEPTVVDLALRELADEVTRGLPVDLGARRIEVVVDDGVRVRGERAALERVLVNLLTNSLKYSDDDTAVQVFAAQRHDRVQLLVADRGRGIDEADLPHIFEEFQRGRLSQEDGGVGLGLASVERLVEQMGGTVSITSRVGVGTTVTVELPAADPA